MMVPFGEYTPDLAALGNAGATVAQNVLPHSSSYKPLSSLSAYSGALNNYCRGAYFAMDINGVVYGYAGDATKLYNLSGTTWNDYSKVGGYSNAADSYWEFIKWGNKCIATNFDDNIQSITLGGPAFADLAAGAPKARHIAVLGDFVVVGNTYDTTDGIVPNRVRWSGFNNETQWTPSASTQSDYQDLQGNGGWVQSIIGSQEIGVVFQERAIWLMRYVGSPVVFEFTQVEDARGALAARSVIPVGNKIFYLADDGFYMFSGGVSVPIGANKIDKTFLADLDSGYIHRINAAADPINKIVCWSYPGAGNTGGNPNKVIFYDWANNKWSTGVVDTEFLMRSMSLGYTLEGLDAISTSLDALAFSLDSRAWTGGKLQLAAFDSSHRLGYFNGSTLAATIETGEFSPFDGNMGNIVDVRPLVDGGTHTIQVGSRVTQGSTNVWSAVATENTNGSCNTRTSGRYFRIRANITGSFSDAIGVDVSGVMLGKR